VLGVLVFSGSGLPAVAQDATSTTVEPPASTVPPAAETSVTAAPSTAAPVAPTPTTASRSQRNNAEGQLAAALEDDHEIAAALKGVNREVQELQAKVASAERQLENARLTIASSEEILAETGNEVEFLSEQLETKAIEGFRSGQADVGVVFSGRDLNESIRQAQLLRFANLSTAELLENLTDLREDRRLAALDAERAAQETALVQEELAEELLLLEQKQRDQLSLKLAAEGRIARWEAELSAYAAEDAGIQRLIEQSAESAVDIITEREASTLGFQWPVVGRVSSPYGYRIHPVYGTRKLHTGTDVAAPHGTPIAATSGGSVIFAGGRGGYGNTVIIDHGGGVTSLYAHMTTFRVSVGQAVERGAIIGQVGSTGTATGPHLHFEIRLSGNHTNPQAFLP